VEDLVAAARFLEKEYSSPGLLIGHSLGGAAVIKAALELPAVKAVVSIGAPADPGHLKLSLGQSAQTIQRAGRAEVKLVGRKFTIKKQFLDDLQAANMQDTLSKLDRALLVLHSPLDNTVGIENAGQIFQSARHPKSFVSLDSADHLLSNPDDSRYAGRLIAAWASRYVGE
jgi:putative redox protein